MQTPTIHSGIRLIAQDVVVRMAKQALDQTRFQGRAVRDMLESSRQLQTSLAQQLSQGRLNILA